jgi:hypothetical protein
MTFRGKKNPTLIRKLGIEERDFRDRRQSCEGSSERKREPSEFQTKNKTVRRFRRLTQIFESVKIGAEGICG